MTGTFFSADPQSALLLTQTQLVYLCIGAVAAVAAIVLLCLLLIRFPLTIHLGDGRTVREKHAGFSGVRVSPPAPREGFTFAGWYLDRDFHTPCGEVYRMPFGKGALYAKWVPVAEEGEPVAEEKSSAPAEVSAESAAVLTEEAVPASETPVESGPEPAAEIPAEESPAEGGVAEEVPAEEPAAQPGPVAAEEEPEEEDETEASEGDEIDNALVTTVTGAKVFVQYRRSFTARLIQSDDAMKDYYNRLRSALLSCKGVKERSSWNYDSYNVGRRQFAKVNANRKSLILYLALDPAKVDEKYHFRDVSEKRRYANVPVRYKITGSRSFAYALELLSEAAAAFGLAEAPFEETLSIPYEERDALIRRGLIKVYAKKETGETVTAEQLETMLEEGATVESLSAYTVTDRVSVGEAETLISDATAKELIALADVKEARVAPGKRTYVNLDTISAHYREGETVDLQSLKERGLIDKKASACKVLARGSLDKSLTVEAADFSLPAIKMIVLTGGRVVRLKKGE